MNISTEHRLARLVRLMLPTGIGVVILGSAVALAQIPHAPRARAFAAIVRRLPSGQWTTVALAIVALIVAMLQISRQGSVAQWLYRRTVGVLVRRAVEWWRLAGCLSVTRTSGDDDVWRRCRDVEVLVRPRGVPSGFVRTEIIMLASQYATRLRCNEYDLIDGTPRELAGRRVPAIVKRHGFELLSAKYQELKARGLPAFFNGSMVRLEDYCHLHDPSRARDYLVLRCGHTDYYSFVATNETIEEFRQHSDPVRDCAPDDRLARVRKTVAPPLLALLADQKEPYSRRSPLANGLVVNLNLMTSDQRLIYVLRSDDVARHQKRFASAVSGNMDVTAGCAVLGSVGDLDSWGRPDPFVAAAREAWEELNVKVHPEDIRMLALCRERSSNVPFMLGLVSVPLTLSELLAESPAARDKYETESLRYFDVGSNGIAGVIEQLAQEKQNWGQPSALGVLLTIAATAGSLEISRLCARADLCWEA